MLFVENIRKPICTSRNITPPLYHRSNGNDYCVGSRILEGRIIRNGFTNQLPKPPPPLTNKAQFLFSYDGIK